MGTLENRAPSIAQVKDAAASIVSAFAATDTDRYFAGFAPEASFVFHTEQERLEGRAAYESLWAAWLNDGWRVVDCQSSNQHVTVFPGGAVFVHDVAHGSPARRRGLLPRAGNHRFPPRRRRPPGCRA